VRLAAVTTGRQGRSARGAAEALILPARETLLHLACVASGLGVALVGALLFSTGNAALAVGSGQLFALGAAGLAPPRLGSFGHGGPPLQI
jgi:hypothetical protein